MTDSELIRRCQRGDGAAFRHLYERHVRMALRIAQGTLRDPRLAEVDRVDPQRPFGPWLTRIVVNESVRLCTRRARGGEPANLPDQPDPSGPERVVTDREVRQILRECLSLLPPTLRALVTLKYSHELSDPEIAAAMECPVGTVKSRLARALRLLQSTCRARGLDWILGDG